MKALTKEQLILAIQENFKDGNIILENSIRLQAIWSKLGHDWHIEGNEWTETKYNSVWGEKND